MQKTKVIKATKAIKSQEINPVNHKSLAKSTVQLHMHRVTTVLKNLLKKMPKPARKHS